MKPDRRNRGQKLIGGETDFIPPKGEWKYREHQSKEKRERTVG